jgi:hypothetical protein
MNCRRLFVSAALASAMTAAAWAGQATVTDDAYTSQSRPTTPQGGLPQLLVDSGDITYLKFDLSTLPSGTQAGQVLRATLLVWVNRVTTAGLLDVSPVTGAWDENSLTFGSSPANGAPIAQPVSVTTANQWVRVNVTPFLQARRRTRRYFSIPKRAPAPATRRPSTSC